MPAYDYRCNSCKRRVSLFYKTYKDYDAANESGHTCPNCGSHDLTRLISRVAVQHPGRNYANMSSDEMLSVLESGDTRQVGQMMHQLGQDEAIDDPAMQEVAGRLMKGEDPERIERDLEAQGIDLGDAGEGGGAGLGTFAGGDDL
jgi:putative FmdB family regulatory protein